MGQQQESRLKILQIRDQRILELMTAAWREPDRVVLPVLDLPEGFAVRSVHADWRSRTFGFVIEHESFPVNHDGCEIQCMPDVQIRAVSFPIAKDGKAPASYEALQARIAELEAAVRMIVERVVEGAMSEERTT